VSYQQPPQQTPSGQPDQQPGPYGPFGPSGIMHAPPPRPRSKVPVLLMILGVVGAALVFGLISVLLSGGDGPAAPKAATTTAAAAAPTTEATTAAPAAPDPRNFTATPKVISKKCFGSAGCNISLRIDLAASVTPEPGVSWLIAYEIRGVQDGPQVGSLTLTGDSIEGTEERVSTASSKSKITIKVVSVEMA
jgi:hypothetical protein